MVSFGALMDGYHGSIDGNIVANKGFVAKFGAVAQNGSWRSTHIMSLHGVESRVQRLSLRTYLVDCK